jgi:hypothetical protein
MVAAIRVASNRGWNIVDQTNLDSDLRRRLFISSHRLLDKEELGESALEPRIEPPAPRMIRCEIGRHSSAQQAATVARRDKEISTPKKRYFTYTNNRHRKSLLSHHAILRALIHIYDQAADEITSVLERAFETLGPVLIGVHVGD